MFHWICPECGREIAPGVKECPSCDGAPDDATSSSTSSILREAAPRNPFETTPAMTSEPVGVASATGLTPEIVANSAPTLDLKNNSTEPSAVDAEFTAAKSELSAKAGLAITPTPTEPNESPADENLLKFKAKAEPVSSSFAPADAVLQGPLPPSLHSADPISGFGLDGLSEPRSLLSEALEAFAEAVPATPKVEPVPEPKADLLTTPATAEALAGPPAEGEPPVRVEPVEAEPRRKVELEVVQVAVPPTYPLVSIEEETVAEVRPLALLSAASGDIQPKLPSEIEIEVLRELAATGPALQEPSLVIEAPLAEPLPVAAAEFPGDAVDRPQPWLATAEESPLATPVLEKVTASSPALAAAIAKPPIRQPQVAQMRASDAQAQRDQSAVAVLEAAPDHKGAAAVFQSSIETQAARIQQPGSKLAMGALRNYSQEAASRMRAAAPLVKVAGVVQGAVESLPGPALPVELTSLKGAGVSHVAKFVKPPAPPPKSSNWMVSFLVAATLLAGCLGLAFYAMPGLASSLSPTKPEVADQVVPAAPTPTKAVADVPANPLQPFVEVTGFRLVTEPGKSPEIHYLIVNHSGAALLNATVTVTLHAADATADQTPISRFSFKVPELGGYRSKDMISPVDKLVRASDMPSWQDLRANVEISR